MKKHCLSLILSLLSFPLFGQGLDVLETKAPQTVPFAKPFEVQAVFSHPTSATVQLQQDSIPTEFALTNIELQPISPQRTQADLVVMPLTLGKSTFTASFALNASASSTTISVPLDITPVELFKDKELKEIRPPHFLVDWVLWGCILLAILILISLLIWWIRRVRQDAVLLAATQDNRPAHIIALSQIDALVDSGLWENKQYKLFYITLSNILRTYLQKAFGLDVSADTSAELLRRMKTHTQLATFIQDIRAFLASGDLVKFAKAQPSEATRNQDVSTLRSFINQTAPKPQPQPPQRVEVKI